METKIVKYNNWYWEIIEYREDFAWIIIIIASPIFLFVITFITVNKLRKIKRETDKIISLDNEINELKRGGIFFRAFVLLLLNYGVSVGIYYLIDEFPYPEISFTTIFPIAGLIALDYYSVRRIIKLKRATKNDK